MLGVSPKTPNGLAIGADLQTYVGKVRAIFRSRSVRTAILGTLLVGAFALFLRSPAQQEGVAIERYPNGRWRLAPFAELNRTVLWVSHIVILHKDSHAALA